MSARRSHKSAEVVDLNAARAVLHRFTKAGRAQGVRQPINFDDRFAVAALELWGSVSHDPCASDSMGAWLHRLKGRGAGHCTPLHGAAEGLHVLVLDAQAVAELWDAVDAHRTCVAEYTQMQADLAHIRKLRGEAGGAGEVD